MFVYEVKMQQGCLLCAENPCHDQNHSAWEIFFNIHGTSSMKKEKGGHLFSEKLKMVKALIFIKQ